MLLKEKFDISTCSFYEGESFEHTPGLTAMIGHVRQQDLISEPPIFMKTHESTGDDSAAIYIIRDGRAAIVSYFHYLRDVALAPSKLEDVITGNVWIGSWANHYRGWLPMSRPRTLMIRYEDLVERPDIALEEISNFIGLPLKATGELSKSFADLHSFYPQFFRSGSNDKAISEIEPYADLFWKHHGDVMDELGYRC